MAVQSLALFCFSSNQRLPVGQNSQRGRSSSGSVLDRSAVRSVASWVISLFIIPSAWTRGRRSWGVLSGNGKEDNELES